MSSLETCAQDTVTSLVIWSFMNVFLSHVACRLSHELSEVVNSAWQIRT